MGRIKMAKEKKRRKTPEEKQQRRNFIASMVLLFIMLFSIAGFALVSSGGGIFTSGSSSQSVRGDVPLGQHFQDSTTGQLYWGAVIGGEQFIFYNGINGYEENYEMMNLAEEIKSQEMISVYVDDGFFSDDSIFVITKALNALGIPNVRISNPDCSPNVLFMTNNLSMEGNCMIFMAEEGAEFFMADPLVFHLIK